MTDDDLHALRLRTQHAADFTHRIFMLEMVLFIFAALSYLELAWLRALGWWLEIGCSARSLPALYAESLGVEFEQWNANVLALCLAIAAPAVYVIATNRRPRR